MGPCQQGHAKAWNPETFVPSVTFTHLPLSLRNAANEEELPRGIGHPVALRKTACFPFNNEGKKLAKTLSKHTQFCEEHYHSNKQTKRCFDRIFQIDSESFRWRLGTFFL